MNKTFTLKLNPTKKELLDLLKYAKNEMKEWQRFAEMCGVKIDKLSKGKKQNLNRQ